MITGLTSGEKSKEVVASFPSNPPYNFLLLVTPAESALGAPLDSGGVGVGDDRANLLTVVKWRPWS